jgi:hypothetical protein
MLLKDYKFTLESVKVQTNKQTNKQTNSRGFINYKIGPIIILIYLFFSWHIIHYICKTINSNKKVNMNLNVQNY